MKRNDYYPKLLPQRPEWHANFAAKIQTYDTALALTTTQVNAAVADNLTLEYGLGGWITNVRDYAPACTSSLTELCTGTGGDAYVFPVYAAPTLPTLPVGTTVLPGALDRTFRLVQEIKNKAGYTEAIGIDLGIVGEEDTAEHPRPEFNLKTEAGDGCHCVKVRFKKFGHYAVAVYSKRGTGGTWELLGIANNSPYEDERPLLVAGQPEIREYKLRFWDAGEENGDWTDVASVTVSL